MTCGKFKTEEPGCEHLRGGGCLGIDRFRAGERRGFDFRSQTQEGVQRCQEAGEGEKALAVQPFGKQTVQKAGEIASSGLGLLHVGFSQCDGDGFLSLGRSASAFALSSDGFFLHVLKIYVENQLTATEFIGIHSRMAQKAANAAARRLIDDRAFARAFAQAGL